MFVKICGITMLDDALYAAECGASALGFNFHRGSKRYITPEAARAIIGELPETIRKVGVFVNAEADEVRKISSQLLLDFVQFHGDEPAEYVHAFGAQAIKVFRTSAAFDPSAIAAYHTPLSMIDAYDEAEYGGTGKTADWEKVRAASQYGKIILAGGLTPENVQEAIRRTEAFGVDTASGVEVMPGKKDHGKMKEFIEKAQRANNETPAGAVR